MGTLAAAFRSPLHLLVAALAAAVLLCAAAPTVHAQGGWDDETLPWEPSPAEEDPAYAEGTEEVDPDFAGIDELPEVEPIPPQLKEKPKAQKETSTPSGPIRAAAVPYGKLIATTARRFGVSVPLFTALVWQESGFNARARSPVGARGLTQLMPATARGLGVSNSYDPAQNLAGGAKYLRAQLLRFRSKRLALAAYNAGPGAVTRFRGVPPYAETRNYVTRILGLEARLKRAGVR